LYKLINHSFHVVVQASSLSLEFLHFAKLADSLFLSSRPRDCVKTLSQGEDMA